MPAVRLDNNEIGKHLTELRASSAAGIHNHKPTRSETKRKAIEMSQFDGDYVGLEPTTEDLNEIETELATTKDSDRVVHFNPEEYDIKKNGSDDFTSYLPDEDRYDDDDEYDDDEDGDEADGSFSINY